jgi:hypothetical protein
MSLSCSCDRGEDGWYYLPPEDYTHLDTKRSRKCCSCKTVIRIGELCAKFERETNPDADSVDWRIYGDEKPLASWFMCERCADLYFSITELGFCITIGGADGDMREMVKEYAAIAEERRSRRNAPSTSKWGSK